MFMFPPLCTLSINFLFCAPTNFAFPIILHSQKNLHLGQPPPWPPVLRHWLVTESCPPIESLSISIVHDLNLKAPGYNYI